MTTKERLHKLVDEFSEAEADNVLRLIASRRESDIIDEWGNLSAMKRASTAPRLRRLDEEERVAGHEPW